MKGVTPSDHTPLVRICPIYMGNNQTKYIVNTFRHFFVHMRDLFYLFNDLTIPVCKSVIHSIYLKT